MINLNKYKERIGKRKVQKQLKSLNYQARVTNIESANTIGILFNASYTINFEVIRNLVKRLTKEKKEVHILGYVHSKKIIDHYLYRKGFEFFTQKELNWYLMPKSEQIEKFLNIEFDILLNLSLEDYLPIHFVVVNSKAHFKVSKFFEDSQFADFMIDIKGNQKEFEEVKSQIAVGKSKDEHNETDLEHEMDEKILSEIQLNFLIEQVFHYLSQVKTK